MEEKSTIEYLKKVTHILRRVVFQAQQITNAKPQRQEWSQCMNKYSTRQQVFMEWARYIP